MANYLKCKREFFSKKSFSNLDFLNAVSVTTIANSEKIKMKQSLFILVSITDFLKKFLPLPYFLETLSSHLKTGLGRGRKLMFFHLKKYVILFNSSCVFLLEHIDIF